MKNLARQLAEAQDDLQRKQTDLSSVEAKIVVKAEVLQSLEVKIEALQKRSEMQETEIASRREEANEEFKKILLKAESALKAYKEAESNTQTIKSDIAARILALDKREEVVERKERALKDAEAQVAELHRFMKM